MLRFPPWQLGAAIDVATGLGAKLACSGHYVSRLSEHQVIEDLASYSPVTRLLEFHNNTEQKTVTASLFGLSPTTAKYRNGIGCSLEHDYSTDSERPLDSISFAVSKTENKALAVEVEPNIQGLVSDLLEKDNTKGDDSRAILVVKNSRIIAEAYGAGFNEDTPLLGWSMAKTVTAILAGSAVNQGMLDINQTQLFDEWKSDERSQLSLEHILTMSTGLEFNETYSPGSDSTKMLFSSPSASQIPLNKSLKYPPGQHFRYSSGTANLLSRIVYKSTGNSAQAQYDFLHANLVNPLGLESLVFEADSSGVLIGSSYVYANARDWAKLGQLILNKGEYQGHRIFSQSFAEAMVTPNKSENEPRYGYQLWLNTGTTKKRWPSFPDDAVAMRGNRAQMVLIIPSLNTVIVRLGWTSGHYNFDENFSPIINAINL